MDKDSGNLNDIQPRQKKEKYKFLMEQTELILAWPKITRVWLDPASVTWTII